MMAFYLVLLPILGSALVGLKSCPLDEGGSVTTKPENNCPTDTLCCELENTGQAGPDMAGAGFFTTKTGCFHTCAHDDKCFGATFDVKNQCWPHSQIVASKRYTPAAGTTLYIKYCKDVIYQLQGQSGRYKLSLEEAKSLCVANGTVIASRGDVQTAYEQGMEVCNCGWVSEGAAYFPMQTSQGNCGSSVGVVHCDGWSSTYDVWCKSPAA